MTKDTIDIRMRWPQANIHDLIVAAVRIRPEWQDAMAIQGFTTDLDQLWLQTQKP